MFQPPRFLRGWAGGHVIVPASGLPTQRRQQRPRLLIAVLQLIDLGAQGLHAVKPPDRPPVGQAPQKAAGDPSRAASPAPQLPGHDPGEPPGRPLAVKDAAGLGDRIQFHLPSRLQTAVCPAIGVLIVMGMALHLPGLRLGGGQVIKPPQIHIAIHSRRVLRLYGVGRCPIADGAPQCWDHHAVQRIRIPGAPEILHVHSRLLHGPADLPHEGVFPHPRPALEDHDVKGRFRVHDLGK